MLSFNNKREFLWAVHRAHLHIPDAYLPYIKDIPFKSNIKVDGKGLRYTKPGGVVKIVPIDNLPSLNILMASEDTLAWDKELRKYEKEGLDE